MAQSALLQTITSRRSIRRYTSELVAREVIETVLTAATWAASAHNRQPWRFYVVEDTRCKATLANAMGDRLRRDRTADGDDPDVIAADLQRSYSRITSAPVLIILCLSMADMDNYPDPRRSEKELLMAVQSTAMAGQNLLLAAHDAGLGACWMCAPLFCPDTVRRSLNLPDDWQPQALITLGYPAETREKTRRPFETSVLWR